MKRLKITHKQYETVLLNEQKNRLGNDFESKEVLEEGFKEVLLGVAMLMGVGLTGLNKANAQNALSNSKIMNQIKSTLEDEQKTKELAQAFSEKGISNPDSLLAKNAEKIVDDFNEIAKNKNISYRVDNVVVNNLKKLSGKLEKGYALKKSDISTDTIKGVEQKINIVVIDTVDIELDNDNFFESGSYNFNENGLNALNSAIDTIKLNGGKILSAYIESSTDAEATKNKENKTQYDETGNIKLAELRAKMMTKIINDIDSNIIITHREIPNNGSDVVNTKQFYDARSDKEEIKRLRNLTSKFRYVNVSLIVEFSQEVSETVKPEEIVEKYRFELAKIIKTNSKTFKQTKKTFNKRKLKCNVKKGRFREVRCTTF